MQHNWSNANRVTVKKIFSGLNQTEFQSGRQGWGGGEVLRGWGVPLPGLVYIQSSEIHRNIKKKS